MVREGIPPGKAVNQYTRVPHGARSPSDRLTFDNLYCFREDKVDFESTGHYDSQDKYVYPKFIMYQGVFLLKYIQYISTQLNLIIYRWYKLQMTHGLYHGPYIRSNIGTSSSGDEMSTPFIEQVRYTIIYHRFSTLNLGRNSETSERRNSKSKE